ncbi:MAG: heavy metal-binding domain-containing protein [Gemmataceae bacterium]
MASSDSISPSNVTTGDDSSARLSVWLAVRVLIVRLRFFLVLLAVLSLVGFWPILRHNWQRWTGAKTGIPRGMDCDLEFWCPMCPGVVSDWPGKCPVCNMALVRRKKGEATPLPDGVLARMQFSPYRIQLAGIRTAIVEYRPLCREIVLLGTVERSARTSAMEVRAEAFVADLPFLSEGQAIEAGSEALAGHAPFRGRIARIEVEGGSARQTVAVRLEIDDPDRDLRSGMLVTARAEAPIARLPWWRRAVSEEECKASVCDVAMHLLLTPALPSFPGGLQSLLGQAVTRIELAGGRGLAVPCGAVIDHGSRKVVFVENGPGMFDAVEIAVGPRCGDYYPVLRGLDAQQRVAARGAFLLDAEMWLNHGLAASYFGATRSSNVPTPAAPSLSPSSTLEEDRLLAAKQKICPVTGEPLDSMGGPVRLVVEGRIVFVCCKSCEGPLRKEPAKYLAKLPAK